MGFSSFLALFLLAAGVAQAPVSDEFLLAPGRAGRFETGMLVDELYRMIGRQNSRLVDLQLEGMFSPAIEITLPGAPVNPSIVAEFREVPCGENALTRIRVRDPRYRTRDGFGVGSTVGEIRRAHSVRISNEEGYHGVINDLQMTVSLTTAEPVDRQRVTQVMLWGDFVAIRAKRCPQLGPLVPRPSP